MIETSFTPALSLAGGILIGLAAVALMALSGRIMGATGILSGALRPAGWQNWSWRAAILAGMVSGPAALIIITGQMPRVTVAAPPALLVVGGVIVGVGVTFGSGCTSGHGVCGMARLSPRSVTATLTFMATAAGTVFVTRHLIGG